MGESYLTVLSTRNHTNLDFIIFDLKVSVATELLDHRLIRLFYESFRSHFQGNTRRRYQLEYRLVHGKDVLIEVEVASLLFRVLFVLITECFTCDFNPHECSSVPEICDEICMWYIYHRLFLGLQTRISDYQ